MQNLGRRAIRVHKDKSGPRDVEKDLAGAFAEQVANVDAFVLALNEMPVAVGVPA